MIQGVTIVSGINRHENYIGYVEDMPVGSRYYAWSEPIAMGQACNTYLEAVHALESIARLCGMEGTLRTPEHRMEV